VRGGDRIAAGELTYSGVGATESGELPADGNGIVTRAHVGDGEAAYRRAVDGLMTWQLHRGAGLRIRAESGVAPGVRVVSGFGVGPFRIDAPCEVVWVHPARPGGGPQSAGFGYGTLPGHPVRGEESFEISLDEAGRVLITITAFGVPSTWFYAAGRPVTDRARRLVTSRYVRSAQELAAGVNRAGVSGC